MRAPLRVAAGVALVLVGAGAAVALLLPCALASDAVRGRIETAAGGALGREVRCARLEIAGFPPVLRAFQVAVAGASAQEPPLLEAERATLRVALLPLRSRRLQLQVALDGGRVRLEDMLLRGHIDIAADVAGGLASPHGRFDIDATEAEIRYGGMFEKPPGDAATVTGTIVTRSDGTPGVGDVHLTIRSS